MIMDPLAYNEFYFCVMTRNIGIGYTTSLENSNQKIACDILVNLKIVEPNDKFIWQHITQLQFNYHMMSVKHIGMLLWFYVYLLKLLPFVLSHQWNIKKLCFEFDTEPYYQALSGKVEVSIHGSLTLFFLCT